MDLHLPPPLWREGLLGLEAAALLRSPVWRGLAVPRGAGDPVLLIPGFMAGDGSLGLMTRWLRTQGYRTKKAGIRTNVGCSASLCQALEQRLEEMADHSGRKVAIIGQSRGGIIGRALAVRRPDLVSGLVSLGSPTCNQLKVHPLVAFQIGVVGALGTLGRQGCFNIRCLKGACCEGFRGALCADMPKSVSYVSVYSKHDGIVDWRACLDKDADCLEVSSSHCGMAVHPDVYRIVGDALADFGRRAEPPLRFAEAA